MSISATRSTPQDIESLLIFKKRPQIKDSSGLSDLNESDVVTAKDVNELSSELDKIKAVIPDAPEENGTYFLKCTVSGSTSTFSWAVS